MSKKLSSYPFYIVSYYIRWVITSWASSNIATKKRGRHEIRHTDKETAHAELEKWEGQENTEKPKCNRNLLLIRKITFEKIRI